MAAMKGLFIFLLGLAIGALGLAWYRDDFTPKATVAREKASALKDSVDQRLKDWHLTPEEIKADLQKTGEVVRSNAKAAGGSINDARIVAQINAKLVLDADLSARAIDVDCSGGRVTLRGTVPSEALLGRAVALALDTSGVANVASKVSVKP
jgi:lambda repressor-like predicted transcriptional regulator